MNKFVSDFQIVSYGIYLIYNYLIWNPESGQQ